MNIFKVSMIGLGFTLAMSAVAYNDFINGREAQPGDFPEVVFTKTGGVNCTGTLVGPRVLLTSAGCGRTGDTTRFQIGQTLYSAVITRSPVYDENSPERDHDMALALVDKDVTDIAFASIAPGAVNVGKEITMAGYGCVTTNGEGGSDGILRYGNSTVRSFANFDMISNQQGGGALCFGDFGGPTFSRIANAKAEHHWLVGVNSKGNIKDTSWSIRLDVAESQDFLKSYAQENSVAICGVNKDCGGTGPGPSTGCAEQLGNLENARQLLNIRMNDLVTCMTTVMQDFN